MAKGIKTGGRKKGTPNKLTGELKEMILQAAEAAHSDGTVGYLTHQAGENPVAFMALLGKVLPMTVEGTGKGGALRIEVMTGVPRDGDD